MSYKQVILLRKDLKLSVGKAGAQIAHASTEAVLKSEQSAVEAWNYEGSKKVVLRVESEQELLEYQQKAKVKGLVATLITDAGRTAIKPGTKTCLAVGPAEEERIDAVTGDLKMY
jgi:PTH2 family peptidyl-tRNA hydrolase